MKNEDVQKQPKNTKTKVLWHQKMINNHLKSALQENTAPVVALLFPEKETTNVYLRKPEDKK
ncbi:hypothetical protein [Flavobacterium restrictum]|uniref:Uncharacterized protein n=1 Tax=Flavobacterium restrictum TaxID=2594428 RepID=A0A553DSL2_9FLAO|nr:hypothetical protein [Flavobacterium restrictum]TRX35682.1 hypothetical protein FNW21_14530 [Flavobacterium restrictum]